MTSIALVVRDDESKRLRTYSATDATAGTIQFTIAGTGRLTIQPAPAAPTNTQQLEIDGTTEPDFAGSLVVELDGSLAGTTTTV